MEFCQQTLENGLEVLAECNPRAYSTALAFFVNTGSRDETDEVSGVSHFLEHMTFKGTATRSAADVNRQLDEIGSHSNAYTSEEHTVYYATVLPEYQRQAVELLADIMRPALREEDFNTEKQVIIEEIHKYEDQPPFGAHEKCMAIHFARHPLARNILGTVDSVGGLTPEAMRAYFQERYSPGNMALVAAGNVDFDRLVELAEKYCGSWPSFQTARDCPAAAPPHEEFQVIHKESATQEYAVQIAAGPAAKDDDRYAGRVLSTVLGDDSGSRLYWELVETGLAEYAAISPYEFEGAGLFMTFLCCSPEQMESNLQRVLNLEQEAEANGITQDELDQAKSKICSHVVLRSERPSNRLFAVGGNWIQRREYRTVREVVDQYQAITRADLAAVLEKYPFSVNTTVVVGPLKDVAAPKCDIK